MKRHLIFILLIMQMVMLNATPAHALWWMVYHKPAFKGKVIDAETKEPIEGAVVVVTYSKKAIRIGPESVSIIIDVKETLTDKDGVFYIPSYTTIIDPLAWSKEATFIIFKPSYGSFPDYQTIPSGIKPKDEEIFFSRETGKEGELEMWVDGNKQPELKRFKVTFGIVELPKLKTREERRGKGLTNLPSEVVNVPFEKIKNLLKAIDEERLYVYGPSGPIKR